MYHYIDNDKLRDTYLGFYKIQMIFKTIDWFLEYHYSSYIFGHMYLQSMILKTPSSKYAIMYAFFFKSLHMVFSMSLVSKKWSNILNILKINSSFQSSETRNQFAISKRKSFSHFFSSLFELNAILIYWY